MDKSDIATILNEIGMMLEIKGESHFKSQAYYEAARAIMLMEENIGMLVKEDRLKEFKGFGKALSQKIGELVNTGRPEYYEKLKKEVPPGLLDMLRIPGLGPKKVRALYENLGITTISELEHACLENNLAMLKGFGEKTQQRILGGIRNLKKYEGQYHYPDAERQAEEIIKTLRESGTIIRCGEAGSLRRRKETVSGIDIIASGSNAGAVTDLFVSHPNVVQVNSRSDNKLSVLLKTGITANLTVVNDKEYPYALRHFTGSREHNIALRHIAEQQGLRINEYGIFRGDRQIKCESEEDIYRVFGLDYIPPELRENNGELEAAKEGKLPELIECRDIKGVLHAHTLYGDGINTIEELAEACIERGYSYLGITDHSKSAYYAGGLSEEDIKIQHEEIDRLNEKNKHKGFMILKGIELDILPDGSVDYDDMVLSRFDFTIASVHSALHMDEDRMTERVIRAMKNKYVTILGHPTGRLLLSREPIKININEIIKTAAEEKVIIEINANPWRLDLDWRYCKYAKEAGCSFIIAPDAHSINDIDYIRYGVNIARKGWLEKKDIVNAAGADELRRYSRFAVFLK